MRNPPAECFPGQGKTTWNLLLRQIFAGRIQHGSALSAGLGEPGTVLDLGRQAALVEFEPIARFPEPFRRVAELTSTGSLSRRFFSVHSLATLVVYL